MKALRIVKFQSQPGENILYRTSPDRKWYLYAWKVFSGLMGSVILTFVLFSILAHSTEGALAAFLPAWAASLLSNILYMGIVPLAAIIWVVEDMVSTYLGEFILTDQRVWVRGSPYAWSHSATPLEDIASLTWRRDAIFLRQKSTRKMQVHMVAEGKFIVKAYEEFTSQPKTP
jgi:hypothetical protein